MADIGERLSSIEQGVRSFIDRNDRRGQELSARMLTIEQMATARGSAIGPLSSSEKSLGAELVNSDGFRSFTKGARSSGQLDVGSFHRKVSNIVSGSWSVGPDFRPVVAAPGQPRLTLRNLIPSYSTVSNLVEWPYESATSGGADYQVNEGDTKPQSDFTYTLQQAPVCTLAHWIAASKQLVDDGVAFGSYIDNRVLYLLQAKTERELLYGSGSSGHLKGICPQASVASGTPTNLIDATAAAISQLAALGFYADGIVANPVDFWAARQLKASGSGVYLVGDPLNPLPSTLWGLSVSLSAAINQGHFLVGVFANESGIFDRQQATLEISREHADFFTRNMVAILAEERLALAVFRPDAFCYGSLSGAVGS